MKSVKLSFAVALVLAAMPLVSFAQEAEVVVEEEASSPFAWSATVTSDYVWRGVSQTDEGIAFQTGLTYTSPFGLYAGVWGSNVDFGAGDPDWEVDGFIGYNTDFGDKVNFDVNLTRYAYPGASDLDWNELITKTTFLEHYSATLAYSNDSWATGENGFYYALGTTWDLPHDFTIGGSVGYSAFDDNAGIRDYGDWSVSLGKSIGPLALSLGYFDTNNSGHKNFDYLAEDRVVLSATVGLP